MKGVVGLVMNIFYKKYIIYVFVNNLTILTFSRSRILVAYK